MLIQSILSSEMQSIWILTSKALWNWKQVSIHIGRVGDSGAVCSVTSQFVHLFLFFFWCPFGSFSSWKMKETILSSQRYVCSCFVKIVGVGRCSWRQEVLNAENFVFFRAFPKNIKMKAVDVIEFPNNEATALFFFPEARLQHGQMLIFALHWVWSWTCF